MPKVYCNNTDCVCFKDYKCIRAYISIGDNSDSVCENYRSYFDTVEYQNVFYICVKTKSGKKAKAIKKGKIVNLNGVRFYTCDDDRRPDFMNVTDEKTGLAVKFTMLQDPKMWQKYLDIVKTHQDVKTLPLAEWDNKSQKYIIKDEETTNDESKKNS